MEPTQPSRRSGEVSQGAAAWPASRIIAALVLVPAVPMLLGSVAALGLFYLAPVRFGALLARLPGESLIRSMLVFAPATLLAVVVMAFLYAVEEPEAPLDSLRRAARTFQGGQMARAPFWQALALVLLGAAAVAFLISLAAWALSFLAPGRFAELLAPLPGDRYLRALVPVAPWLILAVLVVLTRVWARFGWRPPAEGEGEAASAGKWFRMAVGGVLLLSLPALGLSLIALAGYALRPARFEAWVARLPLETLLRAGLLFAPLMLFALVVLAGIYLLGSREGERGLARRSEGAARQASLATLGAGLIFSASLGLALMGAIAYLLVRGG